MAEKIRILYVDDASTLLELGKMFLEQSGDFTVATATSAPEAIPLLEREHVDAIVSDYQMPEMDGIEFLVHVRTHFGSIPFILFTGKGREEVVIQAINSGADFYLQKGGDPKSQFAELAHKIKKAVEGRTGEEQLKKSQIELAAAMDLAQMVNWEFDVAQGLFTFNDRFYTLYGTTAEREVHPDEQGMVANEVRKAIETTDPNYTSQIEHHIVRRDGEIRHIVVRFGITKDARGITVKTFGANQDITDLKQAEEALKDSEERYRTIISTADAGILLQDRSGRILTWNNVAEKIFGISQEEAVKDTSTSRKWQTIHEDGREFPGTDHPSIITLKTGKPCKNIVMGVTSVAGHFSWISINSNPLFRENDPLPFAVVVTFVDITERKVAEAALLKERNFAESIIGTAQAIIIILDTAGHIVYINPYMEEISGYILKEVKGKEWFEMFLPPGTQQRTRALFQNAIREIQTRGNDDVIITKDGRERVIEWNDTTLKSADGSIEGLLAIGQDITDRKRAEESLKKSQEQLAEAMDLAHLVLRIHKGDLCWQTQPLSGNLVLLVQKKSILKPSQRAWKYSARMAASAR
ncbi:MAG: PAS domain S-box protein [Methanoregula sp.]|nr:PAS domain S-box protein [Methanoregula sp.]